MRIKQRHNSRHIQRNGKHPDWGIFYSWVRHNEHENQQQYYHARWACPTYLDRDDITFGALNFKQSAHLLERICCLLLFLILFYGIKQFTCKWFNDSNSAIVHFWRFPQVIPQLCTCEYARCMLWNCRTLYSRRKVKNKITYQSTWTLYSGTRFHKLMDSLSYEIGSQVLSR